MAGDQELELPTGVLSLHAAEASRYLVVPAPPWLRGLTATSVDTGGQGATNLAALPR